MKKILAAAIASLALAGCQSGSTPAKPAATPVVANTVAAAAVPALGAPKVTLTATVAFTGTAPVAKKLPVEADAFCAKTPHTDEEVLVKGGKLQNVVVRVIKGAEGAPAVPATPVVIAQEACMYRPRVQGAIVGQQIAIKSMDDTTHNVHTYKGEESLFNRAETKGQEITKTTADFKQDNGAITFKCDIHPWMTGYVVVNPNSYFGVTSDDGVAKIDLPAGKYTIEAWHEKFGTKTAEVTVEAGKPAEVKFEYAGTEKPAM